MNRRSVKSLIVLTSTMAFLVFLTFMNVSRGRLALREYHTGTDKRSEAKLFASRISVGHSVKDRFDYLIVSAAEKYNMDPFLVKAVIAVESEFNAGALSHKGAKGLMQLMPATARSLGIEGDIFNVRENIEGGTMHLRGLLNRYETIEDALGFYYAGNYYRKNPAIGRKYINKVLTKYDIFKRVNTRLALGADIALTDKSVTIDSGSAGS